MEENNNEEITRKKELGLHTIEKSFNRQIDESIMKLHSGSLRSGNRIEFEGSLVILGDVNAGAEVIAEECNIRVYGIRSDGAIMYEISNEISSREYWIAKSDGNGAWSKRKIWETNNWKFAHILDFNQYGLIIFGKSNSSSDCETIVIKDDGEIIRLDENLTYGKYLFMDNGYFSSNLAKLEHMPWEDDSVESVSSIV